MSIKVAHADKYDALANTSFTKTQLDMMVKNGPSVTLKSRQLSV